ncbi:MAG: hypothetical protein ACREN5_03910 [Gemmatimonadales bacterium]
MPLAPATAFEARAFVEAWRPRRPVWYRFRWRYDDPEQAYGGRGSARIAPPDSMRFDFAGPLGMGSGAAVVIGLEPMWARPDRDFRALVPAVPLLWAAFGVVADPEPGAQAYRGDGGWRFVTGSDTLEYRVTEGPPRVLEVAWRRSGEVVGRGTTEFAAGGWPRIARLEFPDHRARFQVTMTASDTNAVFAASQWDPPPAR